jgi:hypothetical protein
MSKTVSFAIKTSESTVNRLKSYCKEHGIKLGFFVEKAILDEIKQEEMLEDSKDIIRLRHEEASATPIEDYFETRAARFH